MNKLTTTGPSFVMGYWRPWKENSNAFDSFMDYSKDLGLANYTASAVGTYIQEAASQQVDAINNLAHEIGYGMDVLSSQMEDVSGELRFLNRNMDIQIEQQKLSNLLLQNIAELLRVPDSEKERQLCIEMGVKFLVNAAKDPDLYDDALEELHKAEELRKQDYFVLHRLGTIYLYAEKHMNPEKALDYFLLAAKYASVESDPKAMRLANVMTQSFDTVNSGDSTESIQHLAGDSYEKAAFACYVLGRFEEAEKNQQKALKLHPAPENKFLLAKYAVRSGNIDDGVKHLSEAIDESPELMGGVFKELDLANEKAVLEMGKKKNSVANAEIDKTIQLILKKQKLKSCSLVDSLIKLKNQSYLQKVKRHQKLISCLDVLQNPDNNFFTIVQNRFISKKYPNISKDYPHLEVEKLTEIVPKFCKEIKIGKQIWMVENLSVDKFSNGDPIVEAKTTEEWILAGDNKQPAWCWSTDDAEERKLIGKLYNGYAVIDPRGLAPNGWRIPSIDDFKNIKGPRYKLKKYFPKTPSRWHRDDEKIKARNPYPVDTISGSFLYDVRIGYWSNTIWDRAWHGRLLLETFDFHYEAEFSGPEGSDFLENGLCVRCIK